MDNDSASVLEKLQQLKTAKKPELGLDPNIFFTQLPNKKSETLDDVANDDDLFGGSPESVNVAQDLNNGITEDDLFGGKTINIVPSVAVEKIIENKDAKIAEIEKLIANTKIEVQGETKVETVIEDKPHIMVNGVKKYTMTTEDKPAVKLAKATKAIRKSPHNKQELDDVDILEKVLISLMLNNIKK